MGVHWHECVHVSVPGQVSVHACMGLSVGVHWHEYVAPLHTWSLCLSLSWAELPGGGIRYSHPQASVHRPTLLHLVPAGVPYGIIPVAGRGGAQVTRWPWTVG